VNGQAHAIQADPRATLLDTLRETLHLTWTKEGCDHGQCGACTVHVNGRRINNCLALAVMQQNTEITTIEGIGGPDNLHPMQDAFVEHDGFNAVTAHRDRSCPLSPWSKSSGGRQTQKCERR
jgi:xanthine dehydrogenase YagT iron-sulfur-binding subunit